MADSSPIDETHRRIIAVIQPVLEKHGFALAGGNALRVHGLSRRPTRDINMFTKQEGAIIKVARKVEEALSYAGYEARAIGNPLASLARDWNEWNARWTVTAGGRRVLLELSVHDLLSPPVVIADIGPVLSREDALAAKTLAMVDRATARDFIDVFEAMRQGWSPIQLIRLARQLNPEDYDEASFTDVPSNLKDLDDFEFEQYGLNPSQVKELREKFEQLWPRQANPGSLP